jgi:flagellar biosynthesis GTPase FlhF
MNSSTPMIRTFRARDARSALTAVKAAFGSDAVIIETKQIGGGLFGRPQIEVTAASGGERAGQGGPGSQSQQRQQVQQSERDARMESDLAALRRVMDDVRRTLHTNKPALRTRGASAGADGDEAELTADARRAFRHLLERGCRGVQARGRCWTRRWAGAPSAPARCSR